MIDSEKYIPHSGEMVLIKSIIDNGQNFVECLVDVRRSQHFRRQDGSIPSWIGIEYMAQTIAVYAGYDAKRRGEKIKPGFLLGTRSYKAQSVSFDRNTPLNVKAEVLFQNDELASFNCWIKSKGKTLAEARINVYQPQNFEKVIEEQL